MRRINDIRTAIRVVASLLVCGAIAQAEGFSHHGVTWGASEQQVKAAESTAPRSEGGVGDVRMLAFSAKLQGEDATALYRFTGGKLFQISYILTSQGRKCAELLPVYQKVVADLSTQYGNGAESELEGTKPCNKQQSWAAPMTGITAKISTGSQLTDLEVVYSNEGVKFEQPMK